MPPSGVMMVDHCNPCRYDHNPNPLPRSRPPAGADYEGEYDVDHGTMREGVIKLTMSVHFSYLHWLGVAGAALD